MRLRTVRQKLRQSGLPKTYMLEVYQKMRGLSDETIGIGKRNNDLWTQTIEEIISKYLSDIRAETIQFKQSDAG